MNFQDKRCAFFVGHDPSDLLAELGKSGSVGVSTDNTVSSSHFWKGQVSYERTV